jgi:8-oxo-dGTP diphosphatase
MQGKQFRVAYYGLIRNRRGQVLVLRRPSGENHFPGQWELPGGKPDPGETPDQAATREVLEETQLAARPERLAGAVEFEIPGKDFRVIMVVLECATDSEAVVISPEHVESRWVDWDDLVAMDLTPALRSFVASFGGRERGVRNA